MPIPLSLTAIKIVHIPFFSDCNLASRHIEPSSFVNLTALAKIFVITCAKRCSSPIKE
jgi:hypothetical protein